ncbi:MAG: hypothetical protein LBI82_08490 [Dysgonamonadaceae bacterium]|jgi:hypothetical protein|nr:hypothetical protein [Dysgonamonadaceae bacterium]
MKIETNKIKEIFKGHYQVILDFPHKEDLLKIIDISYKYVWGTIYNESLFQWKDVEHCFFESKDVIRNAKIRNLRMEYLIHTEDFLNLIPDINQTIHIIQTNVEPPYYLDLNNLQGGSRYNLLKNKVDYLFELEMPSAIDYAPLVSPNISFLENVIDKLKDKS